MDASCGACQATGVGMAYDDMDVGRIHPSSAYGRGATTLHLAHCGGTFNAGIGQGVPCDVPCRHPSSFGGVNGLHTYEEGASWGMTDCPESFLAWLGGHGGVRAFGNEVSQTGCREGSCKGVLCGCLLVGVLGMGLLNVVEEGEACWRCATRVEMDVQIIDFNDIALDCLFLLLTVSKMIIMNCASIVSLIEMNCPAHLSFDLSICHSARCLSSFVTLSENPSLDWSNGAVNFVFRANC